mgnify:CR=1 FL=1
MYKILMVEDDMVIARKTTQFLGSWGYDAKCVEVLDRNRMGTLECRRICLVHSKPLR